MTSLAQIRDKWLKPVKVEADKIEGEDENGFTFGFDPSNRRKYEQIMRLVHYSEEPEYREAAEKGEGYFCATCHYFTQNMNTSTGYQCAKYLFPDRQEGCCSAWEKKE